jgi:hypothetical protein
MNGTGTFASVEPRGLAVLSLVVVPRRPLRGEDVQRGQALSPHRPPERAHYQTQRHPCNTTSTSLRASPSVFAHPIKNIIMNEKRSSSSEVRAACAGGANRFGEGGRRRRRMRRRGGVGFVGFGLVRLGCVWSFRPTFL